MYNISGIPCSFLCSTISLAAHTINTPACMLSGWVSGQDWYFMDYTELGQCPAKLPFWVVLQVFKISVNSKSFYQMVLMYFSFACPGKLEKYHKG